MKQNVKIGMFWDPPKTVGHATGMVYTYEHPEYLEEGTEVLVDVEGVVYEGEIVYSGHAYDGVCKPILNVLTVPASALVVV